MIRLTRLGKANPLFFLNGDLLERLDAHHDTTVRMTSGVEYIVVESPEAIAELVTDQRARTLARALRFAAATESGDTDADDAGDVVHAGNGAANGER